MLMKRIIPFCLKKKKLEKITNYKFNYVKMTIIAKPGLIMTLPWKRQNQRQITDISKFLQEMNERLLTVSEP